MDKPVEEYSCVVNNGPGPTAYMLPTLIGKFHHDQRKLEAPAWTMGEKLASRLVIDRGPGPIYMIPTGMTARGPECTQKATIKSRFKVREPGEVGPGPTAYLPDININRRKAPAYSLAFRHPLPPLGSGAPFYMLPSTLQSCLPVTIKSRNDPKDKIKDSPPFYNIGSPNLIKNKGGEVTIKSRWPDPKAQSCNASPASYIYRNDIIWRRPPAYSIGVRHSPCAGILKTDKDRCDENPPNFEC